MTAFFRPLLLAAFFSPLPFLAAAAAPLGVFDGQADIGAPKLPGSATYDAASQEYTMTGGGSDMWDKADEYHTVWKKWSGDFILRARVELTSQGGADHRKMGLIVRSSLEADAPYASADEHGDGLTSLVFRRTKGAVTEQIKSALTHADVIQLERRGNQYTFSAAKFGETFGPPVELADLALGTDVYVGLFVCSHDANATATAVFRDFRAIKPMKLNFRAYTEFIGSDLQLLDLGTMKTEEIYSSKVPFEAPNWTHDGAALIYNVSGRQAGWGSLQRFDLATRTPTPIDLATASVQNNNDHVISFDGKMLGISHQGKASPKNGQSAVLTVPIGGGIPKLITLKTPSYFHSWSPDGKFLLIAGGRRTGTETVDKYDIYKIPAEGGDEIKLTNSAGRSDGPEYTPDGKYIYYNSTRAADPTKAGPTMQLWRMQPDGSDPEQVTNDDFNNWFPHISPDGKSIVFISFPKDIMPEDHPYYRECYLRLMPVAGGPAKVIAYIYGGQGTINVPSWAPDSKKLAFVTNNDIP